MNYIPLILASGIFLWQCTNEQQETEKPKNITEQAAPKNDSIVLNENGFKGYYEGPEFNEQGDIAHQFSNKAAQLIGAFMKSSYAKKVYLKADFSRTKIQTLGLDNEGEVQYSIEMPFERVSACEAYTGIEHCGSWSGQKNAVLNQRFRELQSSLTTISVGKMDYRYFETPEEFKEYWIQFKHHKHQVACD